jgi:chromosomal replication initiation ATPase DnaA
MPPPAERPLGELSLTELRRKIDDMRTRVLRELREVEELEKQLSQMMGQPYARVARPVRSRRAPEVPAPAVLDVVELVAEVFGVGVPGIFSPSRRADLAWPRHVSMFLARQHTALSLAQIGQAFGDRDHTTVMHACRKVEDKAAADPLIADDLAKLGAAILQRRNSRVPQAS